jgi:Subtilase family
MENGELLRSSTRISLAIAATTSLLALAACGLEGVPTGEPPLLSANQGSTDIEGVPTRGPGPDGPGFRALSDTELWRRIRAGENRAVVGFKLPTRNRGVYKGRLLLERAEWMQFVNLIKDRHGVSILEVDTLLPKALVQITTREALASIRRLSMIDYLEPDAMEELTTQFGCSENANNLQVIWTPMSSGDGVDAMSAAFPDMMINRAWEYSTGENVKVGLVDTGIPVSSTELYSFFSTGMSSGRSLQHFDDGGNPSCAHGARMAGLIAAPRNGQGAIGVAWRAGLLSSSALPGVWTGESISASEWQVAAGIRNVVLGGARVVAMAFGQLTSSLPIGAEIELWKRERDTFFVGAAGTCSGLACAITIAPTLFPARMPEVFAASGTGWNGDIPPSIVVVDKVNAVAMIPLTTTSAVQGATGLATFSGSSSGTAVISGVAALVFSRYPMWTSDMVKNRLLETVGDRCSAMPSWRNALINAEAAVGGICPMLHGNREIVFDRSEFDPRYTQTSVYSLSVRGDGAKHAMWGDYSTATAPAGVTLWSDHTVTFTRGNYETTVMAFVRDTDSSLAERQVFVRVRVIDRDTDPNCPTCF